MITLFLYIHPNNHLEASDERIDIGSLTWQPIALKNAVKQSSNAIGSNVPCTHVSGLRMTETGPIDNTEPSQVESAIQTNSNQGIIETQRTTTIKLQPESNDTLHYSPNFKTSLQNSSSMLNSEITTHSNSNAYQLGEVVEVTKLEQDFYIDTDLSDEEDLEASISKDGSSDDYAPGKTGGVEVENSIIPEVAATIPTVDHDLPALTTRAFLISTILIIFTSFVGQYYWFKWNDLTIDSNCHIILSYVMGKALERLPMKLFNHSKFNYKEHTLIVIATSAAVARPYANVIFTIQRLYISGNQDPNSQVDIGFLPALAFILSTQLIGIGLGGIFVKFLVYPAEMWWPSNLVLANLIHTFHGSLTQKITQLRTKMFIVVMMLAIVYEIFPQVLMPLLQSISLLCLFAGGGIFI